MPYLWGTLHGWIAVSSGIFLLCLSIYVLLFGKASSQDSQSEFVALSMVGIPLILMGIGILRRKSFGPLLVYISFLYCVFQLCSNLHSGILIILECIALSLGLGFCCVYYFKRRKEFD